MWCPVYRVPIYRARYIGPYIWALYVVALYIVKTLLTRVRLCFLKFAQTCRYLVLHVGLAQHLDEKRIVGLMYLCVSLVDKH